MALDERARMKVNSFEDRPAHRDCFPSADEFIRDLSGLQVGTKRELLSELLPDIQIIPSYPLPCS
jgi:hypothetical protein